MGRDRAALRADARPAGEEYPSALQCPTDPVDTIVKHDGKRELVSLGPRPFMVVNAAQGIEARDIQRTRRDGHREAVFSGGVQAHAVSDPGVGLWCTKL